MIGIDTNILIWGLDQNPTPGLEHMIELAKKFFHHVAEDRVHVVIPAQALAEFLVRNTKEERDDAIAKIEEAFPIAPLDVAASCLAAVISSDRDHCKKVRATFGVTRNCFKADINVLASVINYGASRLVTGNGPEIKALARGKIIVETLEEYVANHIKPKVPQSPPGRHQKEMFGGSQQSVVEASPKVRGKPPAAAQVDRTPSLDGYWMLGYRPQPHPMRTMFQISPAIQR